MLGVGQLRGMHAAAKNGVLTGTLIHDLPPAVPRASPLTARALAPAPPPPNPALRAAAATRAPSGTQPLRTLVARFSPRASAPPCRERGDQIPEAVHVGGV